MYVCQFVRSFVYLICCLLDGWAGCFDGWFVGQFVGLFVGWVVWRSAGWLVGLMACVFCFGCVCLFA